jgi:hypothetical protein
MAALYPTLMTCFPKEPKPPLGMHTLDTLYLLFQGRPFYSIVDPILQLVGGKKEAILERVKKTLSDMALAMKEPKNCAAVQLALSPHSSEIPKIATQQDLFSKFILFLWEVKVTAAPLKDFLDIAGIFGDPYTIDWILHFGDKVALLLSQKDSTLIQQVESFISTLEKDLELQQLLINFLTIVGGVVKMKDATVEQLKKEAVVYSQSTLSDLEKNCLFALSSYLLRRPKALPQDEKKPVPYQLQERIWKIAALFEDRKKFDAAFDSLLFSLSDPQQYLQALEAYPSNAKKYEPEKMPKNPLLRAVCDLSWIANALESESTMLPRIEKWQQSLLQISYVPKVQELLLQAQPLDTAVGIILYQALLFQEPKRIQAILNALKQVEKIWKMKDQLSLIGEKILKRANIIPKADSDMKKPL